MWNSCFGNVISDTTLYRKLLIIYRIIKVLLLYNCISHSCKFGLYVWRRIVVIGFRVVYVVD